MWCAHQDHAVPGCRRRRLAGVQDAVRNHAVVATRAAVQASLRAMTAPVGSAVRLIRYMLRCD